jgi:Flp pilus assembly protein TadD
MDDESLQLLAAAREAFWLRDYETAERNYRELTRLQPDNPDAYGELGNIYFSQGKWDEAGVAYYEAAIRMVEGKRLDDARNLLNIIRGLDAEKGAELEQYILSSAGQSS